MRYGISLTAITGLIVGTVNADDTITIEKRLTGIAPVQKEYLNKKSW